MVVVLGGAGEGRRCLGRTAAARVLRSTPPVVTIVTVRPLLEVVLVLVLVLVVLVLLDAPLAMVTLLHVLRTLPLADVPIIVVIQRAAAAAAAAARGLPQP